MEFHENKAKAPFIGFITTLASGEGAGGGKCRPTGVTAVSDERLRDIGLRREDVE